MKLVETFQREYAPKLDEAAQMLGYSCADRLVAKNRHSHVEVFNHAKIKLLRKYAEDLGVYDHINDMESMCFEIASLGYNWRLVWDDPLATFQIQKGFLPSDFEAVKGRYKKQDCTIKASAGVYIPGMTSEEKDRHIKVDGICIDLLGPYSLTDLIRVVFYQNDGTCLDPIIYNNYKNTSKEFKDMHKIEIPTEQDIDKAFARLARK